MAKKMVQQRYYAAVQDMVDGKLRLMLLDEGKDTAAVQALMKTEDFAKKYGSYVAQNLAFRVAIIRDEPAVRIVAEPSPLAKELAGQIQDPGVLALVMQTLAKHGQATGGQLVFKEDANLPASTVQRTQEGAQEAPGSETEPPKAPEAAAPPPPAPPKTVDPAGKVPMGWQSFDLPQMLTVAMAVNPTVNASFTKVACIAAIGKYLDSITKVVPAVQPPAPPAPVEESEDKGSQDASNIPPTTDVYWVQEECPGCQCLVWRNAQSELRKDAVAGYPEHNCPWYLQLKTRMAAPPPPPPVPAAPPVAQPVAPPAPPAEGMVKPPVASGQAPVFGRGFGVPPLPPSPPKA